MTNESLRQKGEKYLNKGFILENRDKAGQPSIFKLCNNLKISALSFICPCNSLNSEKSREIVTKMGGGDLTKKSHIPPHPKKKGLKKTKHIFLGWGDSFL